MTATLSKSGVICLSSSNHLPPIENSKLVNPVRLPPGRDSDRIGNLHEHDWHRSSGLLQRHQVRGESAQDRVGCEADEFPREGLRTLV
jgi:hypothetical protein